MMRMLRLAVFLLLLNSVILASPISMTEEGIQLKLREATESYHAVQNGAFMELMQKMTCLLDSPVAGDGVFIAVTQRSRDLTGVLADISVSGSCPEGFVLNVPKTTGVQCTFAAGWVDGPTCDPVTCSNAISDTITTTNCTAEGSTAYGEACALQCIESVASTGTPIATCGSSGWETDFQCERDLLSCGTTHSTYHNLGSTSLTSKLDGASYDLTSTWGGDTKIISGGYNSVCTVTYGNEIKCMGYNGQGQIPYVTPGTHATSVVTYPGLNAQTITMLKSGLHHYAIQTSSGNVYTWGYANYYQTLTGTTTSSSSIVLVDFADGEVSVDLTCGVYHTISKRSNGKFLGAGYNAYNQFRGVTAVSQPLHTINVDLPAGYTGAVEEMIVHHYGSLILTDQHEVFGRGSSRPALACSSSVTSNNDNFNPISGTIQGSVKEVHCCASACVFLTLADEVHMCNYVPMTTDSTLAARTSPISITSYINTGCAAGTSRTVIQSEHYHIIFGGTCPKLYDMITDNPTGCTSAAKSDKIYPVDSLPGTYSQTATNFDGIFAV